jgi:periplasmic protein CpxP/Spy
MKKVLLFAIVAIMAIGVNAQNQPPRDGNGPGMGMRATPKERAALLAKQLELTDDQTAQLEELFTKQDKARQEMMSQNQDNREAMREKFMEQRKADDATLEKILGKEKFQKYVEQRQERMRQGGFGGGNGGGPRQ